MGAEGSSTVRVFLGQGGRQILSLLPAFLVYPLIARFLTDEELGIWTLIGAAGFALVLIDIGLSTAVRRSAVTDDDARTRRLVSLTLFVIAALLPAAAFVYWFVLLDFSDASAELRRDGNHAAWVMFAGAVAGAWVTPYIDFNYAKGEGDTVAKARLIAAFAQLGSVAIGFPLGFGLVVPAFGHSAGNLIMLAILLRNARKVDPELPLFPAWRSSWPEARSAFRDGLAALVIHAAVVMALRVDYWVLKWSEKDRALAAGLSQSAAVDKALTAVGRYGLAGLAIGQAYLVAKQANTVLMRRLGRGEERSEALKVGTVIFAAIIMSGMAAIVFDGQPFLTLVLGDKARGQIVAIVLALLGASSAVMATYQVASDMVMLGGRTAWACALPIAVGALVNLVISIAGAPSFGVWAVAGSTLIGNAVTAVMMWRAAWGLVRWDRHDLLGVLVPISLAAVSTALVAWILRPLAMSNVWFSLGACLVVTAIGSALMALSARALWRRSSLLQASAKEDADAREER